MLMKDTANPAEKNTAVGRFAPTPSGRMHLGNVFTALMAYASAHSKGGRCLLRIEDLDRERCPADGVKWLLDDLDYFGLRFDGETLYQSERDEYYARELNKLAEMGLIYPCYCSRAELHASLAPTAPRRCTTAGAARCRPTNAPLLPPPCALSCRTIRCPLSTA